MIFGIAAITLITAGGAGVDFARAMNARNRMAAALDAAGLAVGTMLYADQDSIEETAQTYFDANFPEDVIGSHGEVQVTVGESQIALSVEGSVPTSLLGVAGYESIAIGVSNEITRGVFALEVALVLDNTGSMSGSKLTALKDAATTLIDTLSGNQTNPDKLKIGLVPFSQTVRLNTAAALGGNWIDTVCGSSVAKLNFNNNMCAHTVLPTMNSSTQWRGCVEARPNGLEITDTSPTAGNPDTRWVPYFQPDEPDTNDYGIDDDYTDHYIDDGMGGSNELARLMNSAKYVGKSVNNQVNRYCNMPAIVPLTNNMPTVKTAVNAMIADGYTHIPMGAAWGWRVLSPQAPYTEGAAYDDGLTQKVLILMTDGENTVPSQSTMNKSTYTAFGYLRQGRLGTTTSLYTAENELDDMLEDVCDNVKDSNIRVYTIGFQIYTQNVLDLLEDCATDPTLFYNSPSASSLQLAFSSIASDIASLRLSK